MAGRVHSPLPTLASSSARPTPANTSKNRPTTTKVKRTRSRSNTAHAFGNGIREESPPPPPLPAADRPSIRSRVNTGGSPESDEKTGPYRLPTPDYRDDRLAQKPVFQRTNTSPMPRHHDSPSSERMGRTRSDQGTPQPPPLPTQRSLRPVNTDVFADSTNSSVHSSPDKYTYDDRDRPVSPTRNAAGTGRVQSRSSSTTGGSRKQAPPPPASRGLKKPPPPPPPMKKSLLASVERS